MGELINGRTPEQIRFNISECSRSNCLSECPYENQPIESCAEGLLRDALALIERLESERDEAMEKVPRWISVEERLPDTRGIYLAHIVHRYCKVDSYSRVGIEYFSEDKKWDSLGDIYEITHWMPLPESPNNE